MTNAKQQIADRITKTRRGFGKHTALWLGFLRSEARAWQGLAGDLGRDFFDALAPRELEREVLTRVDSVLTTVSNSVSQELARLDEDLVTEPPLEGYAEMTARAIVAEIPKLTEADCKALMAFEAQNKSRATVLRAAENRLAA